MNTPNRHADNGQLDSISSNPPTTDSPLITHSFRSKGIRIYKPQLREFPDTLSKCDRWEHHNTQWRYDVPSREYRSSDLKVIVLAKALDKIFSHAVEQQSIERFGVLIGGTFSDPASGKNWVEIIDMLPAERVQANATSVEVSHEEMVRLDTKVDKILMDTGDVLRKIGWYHTHPGHGIFMSSIDRMNQKYCYAAEWQIALVVDPIQHFYGIFCGPDCDALTSGILVHEDSNPSIGK